MGGELTDKQKLMLAQIAAAKNGLNRNGLAAQMGKNTLNPSDVEQLEALVIEGYVSKNEAVSGIRPTFIYTLTDAGKAVSAG